jgi:hypothetical protein
MLSQAPGLGDVPDRFDMAFKADVDACIEECFGVEPFSNAAFD